MTAEMFAAKLPIIGVPDFAFMFNDNPLPLYYDALPWVIQTWWQTRANGEESS